MQLYIYDHCPFCVRARMIFGLKNLPVQLRVLANDDDATPIGLVGQKMVPILVKDDGTAMPESLDIVRYVDSQFAEPLLQDAIRPQIEAWLKAVGGLIGHLTTVRFTQMPLGEFSSQSAIDYFTTKKSATLGDFAENIAKTAEYLQELAPHLAALEDLLQSESALNGQLSLEDIVVFPILRNLTCVKGILFPPKLAAYVKKMSELSRVNLYFDTAI